MRLPRFRLCSLLIAVAVVGLVLGGGVWADRMRRRSRHYVQCAEWYALCKKQCEHLEDFSLEVKKNPDQAALYARKARLHSRLEEKYRRAAARPWLPLPPVPPDPPLLDY